jgi:membrane-associated phospholipid phosphatase
LKLFFLFYLSITFLLFPQNKDTVLADIHSFINTGVLLAKSPLSFNNEDLLKFGAVLAAVSAAFLLDHEAKHLALRNRNDLNNNLANIDRYYYLPTAAIIAAGLYTYGHAAEDKFFRQLGLDVGEAAFYANTINIILKFVSGRSRPLRTDNNHKFYPFQKAPIHSSFASAHTTLAFAVSTVISAQMDNIFWKTGWYTAAGLVGAARVYRRMHWFSDVVLGAAIGYYVGSYVTEEAPFVNLAMMPDGLGIRINF